MIKVNVDIESIAGYSACARDILQSAIQQNVELFINPIVFGDTYCELNKFWKSKINDIYKMKDYKYTLSVGLPDRHYFPEKGKYNIGFTHWEVSKIGSIWVDKMNTMDEIWTSSNFAANVFRDCGVKVPITVIPWPKMFNKSYNPKPFTKYQKNKFSFLHMGTYDARKNFKDVILAYSYEFQDECVDIYGEGPDDGTLLILKTYISLDDFNAKLKVRNEIEYLVNSMNLKRKPMIYVVQERVSDETLNDQIASISALAYTTHGEGVGGPTIIAGTNNKPIICAKWSSLPDYVDTDYWVDYSMEPVVGMSHIVPYECNPMWARLNISDLRMQMRLCYNNRENIYKVHNGYTQEYVGNLIKERLNEINN